MAPPPLSEFRDSRLPRSTHPRLISAARAVGGHGEVPTDGQEGFGDFEPYGHEAGPLTASHIARIRHPERASIQAGLPEMNDSAAGGYGRPCILRASP